MPEQWDDADLDKISALAQKVADVIRGNSGLSASVTREGTKLIISQYVFLGNEDSPETVSPEELSRHPNVRQIVDLWKPIMGATIAVKDENGDGMTARITVDLGNSNMHQVFDALTAANKTISAQTQFTASIQNFLKKTTSLSPEDAASQLTKLIDAMAERFSPEDKSTFLQTVRAHLAQQFGVSETRRSDWSSPLKPHSPKIILA